MLCPPPPYFVGENLLIEKYAVVSMFLFIYSVFFMMGGRFGGVLSLLQPLNMTSALDPYKEK